MDLDRKKILLKKYLGNTCTKEELEELLSLHFSVLERNALGEELKVEWREFSDVNTLSRESSDRIFSSIIHKDQEEQSWLPNFSFGWAFKIAAVLLTILIAGISYVYVNNNLYSKVITEFGKTKSITLPDGSEINLNSNSIVRFKKHWKDNEDRIIRLEGEAFFKVAHRKNNQKFIVKTKELEVEVIGTSFNISSRKTKSFVVLQEGKIKLEVAGKNDFVMKPGELVEYDFRKTTIKKKAVNPKIYSSWRNKILTFQSSSLIEIAETIENNYGIKIIIEDKELLKERFTGTFPADEDISLLLTMLSKTYQLDMVKRGDEVIFKYNR